HRLSRVLRRNALALGADYGLFMVGLSFASQATILPAFAAHLGAPSVVIGVIPAVMTLGWFLPSLFAAGHTEALSRKLPFVLRYTVWERVPFLVLALAAFVAAERAPALVLGVLLTLLLVITGVGGVLMPAWMDVVGRAIPVTLRGLESRRGRRRLRRELPLGARPGDDAGSGELRRLLPLRIGVHGALVRSA